MWKVSRKSSKNGGGVRSGLASVTSRPAGDGTVAQSVHHFRHKAGIVFQLFKHTLKSSMTQKSNAQVVRR